MLSFIVKEIAREVIRESVRPVISDCKKAIKREVSRNNINLADNKDYKTIQYSINKMKSNNKKTNINNFDFSDNKISNIPQKNNNKIIKKCENKSIEEQINNLYKSIEIDKIAIEQSKDEKDLELNKKLLRKHEQKLAALEKIWFFEE